jgi:hypothetical protein
MLIRNLELSDVEKIAKIHQEFYANEFSLDEFKSDHFIGMFAAEANQELVLAGGVRLIPEVIVITDKNKPVKVRREALLNILEVSAYVARRAGHDGLHAFIQDEVWLQQLLEHGFRRTKGTAIVTSL